MTSYDGKLIAEELEGMSAIQAKTFGAACAELLVRLFVADVPPEAIDRNILRVIVDTLWNSAVLNGYAGDVSDDSEALHDALLGDGAEEMRRGELPVSGIYYAIQAVRTRSRRKNELVARKLYEAAYFTELANKGPGIASERVVHEAEESPLTQQVLSFISSILPMVKGLPDHVTCASVKSYAEGFYVDRALCGNQRRPVLILIRAGSR